MINPHRQQLVVLDRCLLVLEDALFEGRSRVDGPLARRLIASLGAASLVPGQRLEGRRLERVLDEIFELQNRVMQAVEPVSDEPAEELAG
ncbi:MAG TPA: hypothetical protein VG015_00440 [Candidatus Dormibacteraeota bacterium]|jgi:hypothetical protein|nr:hypothetical protein [Candidatus Dormibacteraeota bacterium]